MTAVRDLPSGSTSLASLRASLLARSELAGVTARMRHEGLVMNCIIIPVGNKIRRASRGLGLQGHEMIL